METWKNFKSLKIQVSKVLEESVITHNIFAKS